MRTDPQVALLLDQLDEAYERKTWHGPNLRGSLRGISAADAAWRPGAGRHNVWEIAVHAAYWKYAVWRRLIGEKRGSFPLAGSNWFRRPEGEPDEAAWRSDLALLGAQHRRLRETVARLRPRELSAKAKGSRYDNVFMVRGIAAHDLYHAGQIQLLKRLRQR